MHADDALDIGEEVQEGLVKAFEAGEVEGAPGPVGRIDTHLNHIFLTSDRAFKLKRAVRLPFVDFRSPEQRRAACEAEFRINSQLGSPFYFKVSSVTRGRDGVYKLEGNGEAEDWVVVMKRFDGAGQFDILARNGALTIAQIEQAAAHIASVHARAPVNKLAGHAADYRHTIRFLRQTEEEAAARLGLEVGEPSPYDRLDADLVRIDVLIEKRRATGKVRRTHGDLHLRNICLFEGKPTLFDALEFDERMATTDVLYDLAFLLMDLRCKDLPRHASAAMNRYWDEAEEDEEALQLLPFFCSLRAVVRMAVAVAAGDLEEARVYRDLAFGLLERKAPVLVAVGGLSGSGKTAVAREIAPGLPGPAGARILRSDILRKRAIGMALDEHASAEAYGPEKRAEVYRELKERAAAACRAGASVVADATFAGSNAREAIAGGRFCGFWLDAPLDIRLTRIAGRRGDASDADSAVAMKQQEPAELGPHWRHIDARKSVSDIAAEILQEIA